MVGPNALVQCALAFALPIYGLGNQGNMRLVDNIASDALAARGWAVQRTPAAEESITLQIGLTMQNQDDLITKLKDVSDPKSANYGKWLDRDDVNKIAQPSLDAADKVTRWLSDSGVKAIAKSADGYWINFRTTVSLANEILGADFVQYQNDGVSKIRTVSYSVPQDVMEHIDLIHPTTFFGETKAFKPVHLNLDEEVPEEVEHPVVEKRQAKNLMGQRSVDASCRYAITPSCLKQLYNVGDYKASVSSGSKLGFGSFLNETASIKDLAMYVKKFNIPAQTVAKVNIANAIDDQSDSAEHGEANLDAQNMVGVANPLPVTEFLTGGQPPFVPDLDLPNEATNTNEPYAPYYQHLLSKTNAELPQAISNSYGEPEHTVPRNYATRVCTMIAMMGLRGVSVFESSGDTGIGSGCLSNDGKKTAQFNPQFPGTCPWVTSIGGTEAVMPEISWRDSSGGFSYYFERPFYQTDAVAKYLTKQLPAATAAYYKDYFNSQGRGFPDVSAHSLSPNYQVSFLLSLCIRHN